MPTKTQTNIIELLRILVNENYQIVDILKCPESPIHNDEQLVVYLQEQCQIYGIN